MTLHPFIGLDESGDMHIYISPFKLYKLSDMHSRGEPFPNGATGIVNLNNADYLLKKMSNYFNKHENNGKTKNK